jgi:hypothetical protein
MRYFFFLQIQMSISQKFYLKKCVNGRDTIVGYFICNSSGIDPGKIGNRIDFVRFSFTRMEILMLKNTPKECRKCKRTHMSEWSALYKLH